VVPGLNTLELPPDVLPGLHRSEPCLVVPDPEENDRLGDVERSLHGLPGVLGPTVPLADAAKSLQWSLEMLTLRRRGVLDGAGLIRTADHLATLLMFQNEELLATLVGVELAPLAGLRPPQRERLTETLLVWLETVHDANAAAARLFVHPQTIRYRVRRLEQLFGDRLQDPDTRLDLELALRARRLITRAGSDVRPLTTQKSPRNMVRLKQVHRT
jgi:DNA-binding PucR family transcriptional regulator